MPTPQAQADGSPSSPDSNKSKSPSNPDPPKAQVDFQFLNFSHPSDARKSHTRRAVRSHVTRQQHQRELAATQARHAKTNQAHSRAESVSSASNRSGPAAGARTRSDVPSGSSSSLVTGSEVSSASPSPAVSPTGERRIDPAEVYPESWHPHIPPLMDYYISHMAIDIPNLEHSEVTNRLRTSFFPLVMSDPALMHTVMLMASAYHHKTFGPQSHDIDVFHLRGMAIREINRALEDPTRATSDPIITAVASMASFEAIYGDRSIFNTHMTALLRMVSLRGGLPALGLDGLLERMLLWIDANTTQIVGARVYFDPRAFPSSYTHPRPDPQRFPGLTTPSSTP